jgi:hypothetical protein
VDVRVGQLSDIPGTVSRRPVAQNRWAICHVPSMAWLPLNAALAIDGQVQRPAQSVSLGRGREILSFHATTLPKRLGAGATR